MISAKWTKGILACMGAAFAGLGLGTAALAANPEEVEVEVEFVNPITITETESLRFGLLDVNMATSETVIIATNDGVTDAGNNVVGGTQGAAELSVTASASKPITILVDNVSVANYYTLGTWMCDYGTGANACDGGGYNTNSVASTTLRVGVTLTKNGTPALAVADNSTFDVTITYQ